MDNVAIMPVVIENIVGEETVERRQELNPEEVKGWVEKIWETIFKVKPVIKFIDDFVGPGEIGCPNFCLVVNDTYSLYVGEVKLTDEEMKEETVDLKNRPRTYNYEDRKAFRDKLTNSVFRMVLNLTFSYPGSRDEPPGTDEEDIMYSTRISDLIHKMIVMEVEQIESVIWEGIVLAEAYAEEYP
jgi:hypothetical protein